MKNSVFLDVFDSRELFGVPRGGEDFPRSGCNKGIVKIHLLPRRCSFGILRPLSLRSQGILGNVSALFFSLFTYNSFILKLARESKNVDFVA